MNTAQLLKECPDFAAICNHAGKSESDYDLANGKTPNDKVAICLSKLRLIYKQFNGTEKPDIANTSQRKYMPAYWIEKDEEAPFGFRLSYYVCGYDDDYSDLGARPYLLESDDVEPVFEQYIKEHEEFVYWDNMANQE